VRRHREARAVAAEGEGKGAAVKRVSHRGDDGRACHVDGLVAVGRDRLLRLHDIGDADQPTLRHRPVERGLHQAREAAKDRQVCIKRRVAVAGNRIGRAHGAASSPVARLRADDDDTSGRRGRFARQAESAARPDGAAQPWRW